MKSMMMTAAVARLVSKMASYLGADMVGVNKPGVPQSLQKHLDMMYYGIANVRDTQFAGGAKGDGVADDTAAIKAAMAVGKYVYFPITAGSYYVTEDMTMLAGQTVEGGGDSTIIELIDGKINGFLMPSGATGCAVRNMAITTRNKTGATAYKAGVNIVESTYCIVENVKFSGMGYHGVRMGDASYNQVLNCRFSVSFGAVQDQADVAMLNNSSYNLVDGNFCFGGGDHGILVQDTYTGSTPTGNIITDNHVNGQKANGILVYVTHAYDTQTIVKGNHIAGIKGTALGGLSGSGVYIQSAGGTNVTDNMISDCCQQTTSFATQGVGAISVAIGKYESGQHAAVIIGKNHINAPRGPGIWCATSAAPILIDGNTIIISSVLADSEGRGIYVVNCDGARVSKNTVDQSNPNFQGIQVLASGVNVSSSDVSDNWVKTVAYGIFVGTGSGGTMSDISVKDNRVYNGNKTAITLKGIKNMNCSGNNAESSEIALTFSDCSATRLGGNRFVSSSATDGVVFSGIGSDNIVDESNLLGGIVGNDASSGVMIAQYGDTAPALSGLWANGDRVIAKQPLVGSPKGWRCTSAGRPGIWVSEGNL